MFKYDLVRTPNGTIRMFVYDECFPTIMKSTKVFDALSIWGGIDSIGRNDIKYYSWEFPLEYENIIKAYLKALEEQ